MDRVCDIQVKSVNGSSSEKCKFALAKERGCSTLTHPLLGGKGFTPNTNIKLVQKHQLSEDVATHLASTYGVRAFDLCKLAAATRSGKAWPKLAEGYPYIQSEVEYAVAEYARTVKDVVSLRTRLAFLDKEAAVAVVPVVARIMAETLGWSREQELKQIAESMDYLSQFGGPMPDEQQTRRGEVKFSGTTKLDLRTVFKFFDKDDSGTIDLEELKQVVVRTLCLLVLTSSFVECAPV